MALDDLPLSRRARRYRTQIEPRLQEVFVVENDPIAHDTLSDHLADGGFMVTPLPDGPSCLDLVATRVPAAIVLDIDSPYESGIDVLRSLKAWQCPSPVVMISRKADVRTAVEAMKCGALDVFERPLDIHTLLACLQLAIKSTAPRVKPARATRLRPFAGRELLTQREREVLSQVAAGASNKEAGRILDISPRTVEVHRS